MKPMLVKININGKEVEIPLTKEQLEEAQKKANMSIMDRVKTVEDACAIKGVDISEIRPYKNPSNKFQESLNAIAELWTVIEVINEGWVADFSNTNQSKYYPYFAHKSGFGLSYFAYACVVVDSSVCVRLCFETSEKATYVGKQFVHLYNKI